MRSDLRLFDLACGCVFAANWIHSLPLPQETATGTVLELRKAVENTRDTLYGGKINYRLEKHVRYMADGQMQDR